MGMVEEQSRDARGTASGQESEEGFMVSPNMVLAYIVNMGKALFFVGVIAASFLMIPRVVEENPFNTVLETIGISQDLVVKLLVGVASVYLLVVFIDTLSESQNRVRFAGRKIVWFEGKFLRREVSAPQTGLTQVNFKKYLLGKAGDISIELSGTQTEKIEVSFVDDVEMVARRLQDFIALQKNESRVAGKDLFCTR